MAVRKIVTLPHAILRQTSAPVQAVTDETRALMDDMLETMYAAHGIGLAAVQVGVLQRVIVMDLDWRADEEEEEGEAGEKPSAQLPTASPNPRYFVNPELVWQSEDTATYAEGCLSIPGYFEEVVRPARCRVRYQDYHGAVQEEECSGLLATCIQHEVDHLNGVLFLDHLSRLKRDYILKKMRKQASPSVQSA